MCMCVCGYVFLMLNNRINKHNLNCVYYVLRWYVETSIYMSHAVYCLYIFELEFGEIGREMLMIRCGRVNIDLVCLQLNEYSQYLIWGLIRF